MSAKCPKVAAAKCQIGSFDASKLTISQFAANGLLTNPGVSIFGESLQFGVIRAGVTIGLPMATPGLTLPRSLEVAGWAEFYGKLDTYAVHTAYGLKTSFAPNIKNSYTSKNKPDINNSLSVRNKTSIFNGLSKFNGKVIAELITAQKVTAPVGVFPKMIGVATGNKVLPFDLPHWKQRGKRIRHICVEGPEAGIYIRGRLKDSNVIELPEYWDGLVDYDSISVQLQPIGDRHYHINVIEIDKEKVVVKEADDKPFECFYHIWVARWINPTDHNEKLHVVYDGESPDDYPGNNANYLIGGWDYDRRETQWSNE
jgi:hypothetical protein